MALDEKQIKSIVEAALYAAEGTLNIERLLGLFIEDGHRPTREQISQALEELREDYRERGVQLKEVSTGFRFQVDQDLAPWVSRLWEEKPPRYSRALLETLALIAYRQPITRAEIEEIRGVSVSSTIVKTLIERDWIKVVGHKEVPGRPALYSTTRAFLDYFNLKSLNELPSLVELKELDQQINGELDLEGEGGAGEGEEGDTASTATTDEAAGNPADVEAEQDEGGQETEASAGDESEGDADDNESGQAVAAGDDEPAAEPEAEPAGQELANAETAAETDVVEEADAADSEQQAADDEDETAMETNPQELAMALSDEEDVTLPAGTTGDSGIETSTSA